MVFDAPTDVELTAIDIVQPDIFVVHRDRRAIIGPKKVIGPPDLAVEILSPSTSGKDRELEYAAYERAGVKECWIVDAAARVVEVFRLTDGTYQAGGRFSERVPYAGIEGVEVDLTRVWE